MANSDLVVGLKIVAQDHASKLSAGDQIIREFRRLEEAGGCVRRRESARTHERYFVYQ